MLAIYKELPDDLLGALDTRRGARRCLKKEHSTPKKNVKAHHEKKQREADLQIQELTKHWENDPKDIAEYLAFSTQFYKYSSRNTMLIYRQRPDSVFIASYTLERTWVLCAGR